MKLFKHVIRAASVLLLAGAALAQNITTVTQVGGPPPSGVQYEFGYDGSNNLIWYCYAQSIDTAARTSNVVAISAATNANPVVFTSTGHGFPLTSRPSVAIVGGTGNWTAVNTAAGQYVTATIIDANTFSIPVNSTALGALTGTLRLTTTAPRLTIAEWAVNVYSYTGTNVISALWLGGNTNLTHKCSDATSTTLNVQ